MKYLILFFTVYFCEVISFASQPQVQTSKVYSIHHDKRPFIKISKRLYLLRNKNIKETKEISNQNKPLPIDEFIKNGNRKLDLKDYKGAILDYDQGLYLEPQNTEALYYRGFVKTMMQDFINALTDFNQAIVIDTESVELYYCRGNANFEMKNYQNAVDDYNKAISLDSTDSESYFNRAIAKYNLSQKESACKDLLTALKYGDKEANAIFLELCH